MCGCLRVQLRIPCEKCGYPLGEAKNDGRHFKEVKHTKGKAWMWYGNDTKTGLYVYCANCKKKLHIKWQDNSTKICKRCNCELVYPHWCEW